MYSTLLYLSPLRFDCVGGFWDRLRHWLSDALATRLHIIHNSAHLINSRLHLISSTLCYISSTLCYMSSTLCYISSTLGYISSTFCHISSTFGNISSTTRLHLIHRALLLTFRFSSILGFKELGHQIDLTFCNMYAYSRYIGLNKSRDRFLIFQMRFLFKKNIILFLAFHSKIGGLDNVIMALFL
jgi:hypothetical protein